MAKVGHHHAMRRYPDHHQQSQYQYHNGSSATRNDASQSPSSKHSKETTKNLSSPGQRVIRAASSLINGPEEKTSTTKRTWGQRLKISGSNNNKKSPSKSPEKKEESKKQPTPKKQQQQMVHHYSSNSPSALSRSMKYADPFMYGTIRGIPVPRVDSCSGFIINPLQTEVAVMVCSCPEYLTGTSKKEVKKASICKKCKGSRLPLAPIGGTVRVSRTTPGLMASQMMMMQSGAATVRLPSSHSMSHKIRPSIFNMQNDPYDLMRRTRLMSPELQTVGKGKELMKNGISPAKVSQISIKNGKRSPSPNENSINKCNRSRSFTRNANRTEADNHKDCWVNPDTDSEKGSSRKSILSCDVNPYELVSHENNTQDDTFKPLSEDIFDAELLMHSKRYEDLLEPLYHLQKSTSKVINNVAAIAGQRIRLFTESTPKKQNDKSTDYEPVEYLNPSILGELNNDTSKQANDTPCDDSKIERSISPKRPPRRKIEIVSTKEVESESIKDPVEISEDQDDTTSKQIELVVVNLPIKSILKRNSQYKTSEDSSKNDSSGKDEATSTENSNNLEQTTKESPLVTISDVNGCVTISANVTPRKKVQFLMQEQIINDKRDDEVLDDESLPESATEDNHNATIVATTVDPLQQDNGLASTAVTDVEENNKALGEIIMDEKYVKITKEAAQVDATATGSNDNKSSSCYNNNDMGDNKATTLHKNNDSSETSSPKLKRGGVRRSLSDRQSQSCVRNTKTKDFQFMDSMALRNKSVRTNLRKVFDKELPKKIRPKEPPPPPPSSISSSSSRQSTPDRPPRISSAKFSDISFSDAPITQSRVQITDLDDDNIYEDFCPGPLPKQTKVEDEMDEDILSAQLKLIQEKQQQQMNQTLVMFNNEMTTTSSTTTTTSKETTPTTLIIQKQSPAVHRLEIKHDTEEDYELLGHKKTSIMITGDDCYSTVNVNDDSTPLYQSSVVVNESPNSLSMVSVVNNTNINTVTISVGSSRTSNNVGTTSSIDDVIHKNNKRNTMLSINKSGVISIGSDNTSSSSNNNKTLINLSSNGTEDIKVPTKSTTDTELAQIMNDPVEAVKRNLVPHFCGKENDSSIETTTQDNNTSKKSENVNKLTSKSSFISKLLEDSTLGHLAEGLEDGIVAKLIENSLLRLKETRSALDTSGTKDDATVSKLIDESLQKVQEERGKMETLRKQSSHPDADAISTRSSISSGNSYGSAAYEMIEFDTQDNMSDCYHSCSSELTTDDDGNVSRTKFYQMLVDATLSEIEIANNQDDDHHYETIRLNGGDPIYEEISDVPPPLPLTAPPDIDLEKKNCRSIFEGASKYDILSYLVDAKERGITEDTYAYSVSDIIVEEEAGETVAELHKRQSSDVSSRVSHISNVSDLSEENSIVNGTGIEKIVAHRKSSADIERNDSGVGSETSKSSRSKWQQLPGTILDKNSPLHLCEDCDGPVETQITDAGVMYAPLVCRKCGKKRAERKEIITEIVETEEKYGRDLQIILEEFYQPMLVAGLLTQEQLSAIFLNTEELLENNQSLAERMRDALDIANEQGDDDLLTVNLGKTFLEAAPMLHSFENYCVRQGAASLLLANLEKEKELLRIFLRVSQMENSVLRRMNLNSFLMVPVQRVTKYPLLLSRLYKVTPAHLEGRELLKQAQEKIELHLNHMNQEAKDVPTKLWRRIASSSPNRRSHSEIDMINIKLRKMAVDVLEWNHDEVRFAVEGKLLFTQPTDNNWKRGRTIKLSSVNALLVTNGKPSTTYKADRASVDPLNFPHQTGIREASLLLVREKGGRYTLVREPLYLDRCVVCTEADWEDYFEVQEISTKDTFIFKAEDGQRTKLWYTQLQYHSQGMGAWRKRRNALANIMINGMMTRT